MRTVTLLVDITVEDANIEGGAISDSTARDLAVNAVDEALNHAASRGFDGSDCYCITPGAIECKNVR